MERQGFEIGVNTFGLGHLLTKDFEGTVQQLKEAGFTSIEPLVVFPEAIGMPEEMMVQRLQASGQLGVFWPCGLAKERIAYLRREGFQVDGIHLGLVGMVPGGLNTIIPPAASFAKELGISYLVHSPKRSSIEEMKMEAEAFRQGLEYFEPYGIELLFHCHYHELAKDHGDTPFDYLMREVPQLRVELDVGWVQYAGADAVELMRRYTSRIALIHFKDLTEDASEETIRNCFAAVGEGTIPLEEIMKEAKKLSLSWTRFVIDQDSSRGDMIEDLRKGRNNILKG